MGGISSKNNIKKVSNKIEPILGTIILEEKLDKPIDKPIDKPLKPGDPGSEDYYWCTQVFNLIKYKHQLDGDEIAGRFNDLHFWIRRPKNLKLPDRYL